MASSLSSSSSSPSSYNKYDIRRRNPDPKNCALLVIDVQNNLFSIAKPIFQNLLTTIRLCRLANIPVIFTRHCHKSPSDYGMLAEWWKGDLILDSNPESELISQLDRNPDDPIVEKTTYSAFCRTRLEGLLEERRVTEVIVTGMMTNLCCETTARDAFMRGYRVFFSADATATSNDELQEATLKNVAYGFAYLVDVQRLNEGLFEK